MDLALINNSLEYTVPSIEQEVSYEDNFESPTWSSSEIISNNEELLSFIGDNNFNHLMDTFDKLNSPTKLDKESDIRESLVEFLQEQLKPSEAHHIKNEWTDFDTNSFPCNLHEGKLVVNSGERTQNEGEKLKCNLCLGTTSNEIDILSSHFECSSTKECPALCLNLTKANCLSYTDDSESKCRLPNYLSSNGNVGQSVSVPHIKSRVGDLKTAEKFNCKLCIYSTEKKCQFKVHILTHIGDGHFICNMCDYKGDRRVYLAHIKQHAFSHFECPLCCYTDSSEASLSKHIVQHTNNYGCTVCGVTVSVGQVNNFSCTICSYQAKHESYIQKHLLKHTTKKMFGCNLCDYKTTHRKTFFEHCAKHSGFYYNCKECNFKTNYRNNIKKHQVKHTGEKNFVCDMCGIKFAQRSNLKVHIATHLGQKNYECYLCDYKATQKINLKAHVITHIGEKNLACNVCNYKALNRSTLKSHMAVHNAEKRFNCSLCYYKTAYKSGLRRHLRVHTGEKKFLCDMCDYKTSRKDYINRHMLKHTGKKNFFCNFCDYKTAYRNSLNVHNALVHTADL